MGLLSKSLLCSVVLCIIAYYALVWDGLTRASLPEWKRELQRRSINPHFSLSGAASATNRTNWYSVVFEITNSRRILANNSSEHHDDDHGGGHIPLFGAMTQIDPTTLTYSLLLVVAAVVLVEYLFHALHACTRDTPFNALIVAIEKELMVVGSTAFILKIFINTSDILTQDWFFALEFADLLVPMFSFSNSILGIVLILFSLRQCSVWSRAYHLKAEDLMEDFYDALHHCSYRFLWAPLNRGVTQVEFCIFHDIFCDLYKIQRGAFAFDQYTQRVYEAFVLSIIEIRLVNWALFVSFLLLNMIRTEHGHTVYHCDDHDVDCIDLNSSKVFFFAGCAMAALTFVFVFLSRHYELSIIRKRGIASSDEYPEFLKYCEEQAAQEEAASCPRMDENDLKRVIQEMRHDDLLHPSPSLSNMVTDAATTLAVKSSNSFSGSEKGHKGAAAYAPAAGAEQALLELQDEGERVLLADSLKHKRQAALRSSSKVRTRQRLDSLLHRLGLGTGVDGATGGRGRGVGIRGSIFRRDGGAGERGTEEDGAFVGLDDFFSAANIRAAPSSDVELLRHIQTKVQGGGEGKGEGLDRSRDEHYGGASAREDRQNDSDEEDDDDEKGGGVAIAPAPTATAPTDVTAPTTTSASASTAAGTASADPYIAHPIGDPDLVGRAHRVGQEPKPSQEETPHSHTGYMHEKHEYVRQVFFFGRPELYFEGVQLLIMVVALYLALWLVNFSSTHTPGLWKLLTFLPALLSALNYVLIVRSAALLKAVYEVDRQAVLEVIEQAEGARVLGDTIRAKLLQRLDVDQPYEQLKELFIEIDYNKSGTLSRHELEMLMGKLRIAFSRKKWARIYREIDRNSDGQVSFEEFFLFLFPTHADAISLERHRLKIVRERVELKRSMRLQQKQQQRGINAFLKWCGFRDDSMARDARVQPSSGGNSNGSTDNECNV